MWLRQKTEIRVSLWMFQVGILFPGAGKGWSEDLPTGKEPEDDNSQQVNADPICNQTLKQIFPRTQNCLDKWTKLMNDQEIIDIVSGYLLDFVEIPHQQKPPTPFNLSKEEEKLVDFQSEASEEGGYSGDGTLQKSIFTIPKKGRGRRPVVDIRNLNSFIEPVHFKMEDLSCLPSVLWRGDFLCKIDLQDAYETIPVAKKSRIYLMFLWKGRLY